MVLRFCQRVYWNFLLPTATAINGGCAGQIPRDSRRVGPVETLFVFTLAVTVAAATPGPSFFALIAGEITLLILAVLGLVALAAQMGELFFAIRLLGAANLFYLEWKLWRMPLGETSPNCG